MYLGIAGALAIMVALLAMVVSGVALLVADANGSSGVSATAVHSAVSGVIPACTLVAVLGVSPQLLDTYEQLREVVVDDGSPSADRSALVWPTVGGSLVAVGATAWLYSKLVFGCYYSRTRCPERTAENVLGGNVVWPLGTTARTVQLLAAMVMIAGVVVVGAAHVLRSFRQGDTDDEPSGYV